MKPLFQDLPFQAESKVLYYIEDLPHFIVNWHQHPAIEIMYITKGTGTRFVGDNIETYAEGDVCMIGPMLPHEWRNDPQYFDEGSSLRATCICLFFSYEIFDSTVINLPELNGIRELIKRSQRGIKFTGKTQRQIAAFLDKSANDTGVRKITNLLELLDIMAQTDEYRLLASIGFTDSVNSEDFYQFNKIYQYLVHNFTQKIKLEDAADIVGLSPAAFCGYFKKRTSKTFVQYLNEMRIGYSKKLIMKGTMNLSTICIESGFNNVSNFINQFRKITGMLPSDYQKEYGIMNKRVD